MKNPVVQKQYIQEHHFDVAVVGGGPAGLAAAIALAQGGAKTALIARHTPYADNRTTALLGESVTFLQKLDVWRRCQDDATALRVMRLVDDTGRLIRAPEVRFSSDEIDLEAFGYNIENRLLISAMEQRAAELPNLTRLDDDADAVIPDQASVTIHTADKPPVKAALVIGADGRHSLCRQAAGIDIKRQALHQSAMTFNVTHTRPHNNTSTEFHTVSGPCVFVPLLGNRSSVVWVASTEEVQRLAKLSDESLGDIAEKQSHSILGKLHVQPSRHVFPLALEHPEKLAAHRIVLIGEAAHVLPPIGAQGLNMGLRDAADIADIVEDALTQGKNPGGEYVLQRYIRTRQADVISRTFAIDVANRMLLSDFLPAQSLRALGLHLVGTFGPLRRLAMGEGLAPSWRPR